MNDSISYCVIFLWNVIRPSDYDINDIHKGIHKRDFWRIKWKTLLCSRLNLLQKGSLMKRLQIVTSAGQNRQMNRIFRCIQNYRFGPAYSFSELENNFLSKTERTQCTIRPWIDVHIRQTKPTVHWLFICWLIPLNLTRDWHLDPDLIISPDGQTINLYALCSFWSAH